MSVNRRWSRVTALGPVISAVAVVAVAGLAFWQVSAQMTVTGTDPTFKTTAASSGGTTATTSVATCGDGTCQASSGEAWSNCPDDCPLTAVDTCGNGRCDAGTGETVASCPKDCSNIATVVCGDGRCDVDETSSACPNDCPVVTSSVVCGDATCDFDAGETAVSCPVDCGGTDSVAFICGDGRCDSSRGESFSRCPADCQVSAKCGDGLCDVGSGETTASCAADCGPTAARCGDNYCQPGTGESEATCPADCRATTSATACGDTVCETGETAASCPKDCSAATTIQVKPSCGNGTCETGETVTSCPVDCATKTETPTFVCSDGRCDHDRGENESNCSRDCQVIASPAVAAVCVDSDGGRDVAVRGTVKFGASSYTDACLAADKVREYVCEGGRVTESALACPVGSACATGRCLKAAATPACGDGRCGAGETSASCSKDCFSSPASKPAVGAATVPILHVDCVGAGLKTQDECAAFLRDRLAKTQTGSVEPTAPAVPGLSPLCAAQGISSLERCSEFLKSKAQPVAVFLETTGQSFAATGDAQGKVMSPECFRLAAKDAADCARFVSGEVAMPAGDADRQPTVSDNLPVSCRERGLTEEKCVSLLKETTVPATCREAGIDTMGKCLAWLAARRLPVSCTTSSAAGCADETLAVLPTLCRNLGVTDSARCRDAFFSEYGLPGRCAGMDMDACWRLVTSGELGDVGFDAKVRSQEVSDECRKLGIKTMDECQKIKTAKSLPGECLAAGRFTSEACTRYLFEKSSEAAVATELPAACREAEVSDAAECSHRLAQSNLPVECAKAGLGDPTSCRRFLEATKLPEACRAAGISDREECEKRLHEQAEARYCANGAVAGDAAACQEAIFREVGARVRCEGLSAAECQAVVKTSRLGEVAEAERMVRTVERARALSSDQPLRLADLSVVSGAGAAEIGKMMPFAAGSDAKATLLSSRASVVMDAAGDVRPVLSAVAVIDRDGDGVPDDMESSLGLDPLKAETQPGLTDGEAFRERAARSGAPVERAVASGQPLGQPLDEGEVDLRLTVRTVSFASTEAKVATKISADKNQTLNFSGNGVPGETVTIYIYSDIPLVMTTTVGEDGEWRLDLDEPLADGVHEAYVAVNDDTGRVIRKSDLMAFVINAAQAMTPSEALAPGLPLEVSADANAASGSASESYLQLYVIGGIGLLLVAMAVAAAVMFVRRKEV